MSEKAIRRKPYTTGELARELGVSVRTIIRACEQGRIEYYWSPGHGRRLVPASEARRVLRDANLIT